MIKKLSEIERMMMLSVSFTLLLTGIRFLFTGEEVYLFYPWNLLLAAIPLLLSRQLIKFKKINLKVLLLLAFWLLFLPNAPYIVTDLFHFEERSSAPYWFDLLIVTSGAWNGLALGFISLMQAERFLSRHIETKWRIPAIIVLLLLCSYGIYLGRFLRYNSWDIFIKPDEILHSTLTNIIHPFQYLQFWGFIFSFAILLCLMYFTIRKLPSMVKAA